MAVSIAKVSDPIALPTAQIGVLVLIYDRHSAILSLTGLSFVLDGPSFALESLFRPLIGVGTHLGEPSPVQLEAALLPVGYG